MALFQESFSSIIKNELENEYRGQAERASVSLLPGVGGIARVEVATREQELRGRQLLEGEGPQPEISIYRARVSGRRAAADRALP